MIYGYGYLTDQKARLPGTTLPNRMAVNQTLTNMRLGAFNTRKTPQGKGQQLVNDPEKMKPWSRRLPPSSNAGSTDIGGSSFT